MTTLVRPGTKVPSLRRDNIMRVFVALMRREPFTADDGLLWDFKYTYFIDGDGKEWGDHLAVFAKDVLKIENLDAYVMHHGLSKLERDFAEYTGMPLDDVRSLGEATANAGIHPRDVAFTLYVYLLFGGRVAPSWAWKDTLASLYV